MLPLVDELVHALVEPLEPLSRESLGLGRWRWAASARQAPRADRNEHRADERQARDETKSRFWTIWRCILVAAEAPVNRGRAGAPGAPTVPADDVGSCVAWNPDARGVGRVAVARCRAPRPGANRRSAGGHTSSSSQRWLEGRDTGSPGHRAAAEYVADQLQAAVSSREVPTGTCSRLRSSRGSSSRNDPGLRSSGTTRKSRSRWRRRLVNVRVTPPAPRDRRSACLRRVTG